ncbi:hypothetical protein SAMN04488691_102478 [Haloferax larsenii]|uniref:Uncharacterized protein n=2 Tax=Haloferax TaxID=2251 RepID=A0A1H7M2M9_HALLR|nr:hypothetical protein C455_13897 [Haloferax larsenii JCM 13917]ELZ88179.1 hypothetical protein C453_01877 [Haloferax elongans ATCC BAA-1513]SEL04975.1 hypothetical protein SAMN04488691_102478 [Haloferax larsenii]
MNWKHRRDLSKAESKKHEATAGTKWSFIAALTVAA